MLYSWVSCLRVKKKRQNKRREKQRLERKVRRRAERLEKQVEVVRTKVAQINLEVVDEATATTTDLGTSILSSSIGVDVQPKEVCGGLRSVDELKKNKRIVILETEPSIVEKRGDLSERLRRKVVLRSAMSIDLPYVIKDVSPKTSIKRLGSTSHAVNVPKTTTELEIHPPSDSEL